MGVVFMFLPASGQVGVNFYENIPGFTVGESGDSIALTSEGGIPAGDTAEVFSFPATPAQVYTLQLDARNASGGEQPVVLHLEFYDRDGSSTSEIAAGYGWEDGVKEEEVEYTGSGEASRMIVCRAPEIQSTDQAVISIIFPEGFDDQGEIELNNVWVEEGNLTITRPDEGISIPWSQGERDYAENLVAYSSFEEWESGIPVGWNYSGSAGIEPSEIAIFGDSSLHLDEENDYERIVSDPFPVQAGEELFVYYWMKFANTPELYLRISNTPVRIRFYDASGQQTGQEHTMRDLVLQDIVQHFGHWLPVTMAPVEVPLDAATARVHVMYHNHVEKGFEPGTYYDTNWGNMYVDNIQVFQEQAEGSSDPPAGDTISMTWVSSDATYTGTGPFAVDGDPLTTCQNDGSGNPYEASITVELEQRYVVNQYSVKAGPDGPNRMQIAWSAGGGSSTGTTSWMVMEDDSIHDLVSPLVAEQITFYFRDTLPDDPSFSLQEVQLFTLCDPVERVDLTGLLDKSTTWFGDGSGATNDSDLSTYAEGWDKANPFLQYGPLDDVTLTGYHVRSEDTGYEPLTVNIFASHDGGDSFQSITGGWAPYGGGRVILSEPYPGADYVKLFTRREVDDTYDTLRVHEFELYGAGEPDETGNGSDSSAFSPDPFFSNMYAAFMHYAQETCPPYFEGDLAVKSSFFIGNYVSDQSNVFNEESAELTIRYGAGNLLPVFRDLTFYYRIVDAYGEVVSDGSLGVPFEPWELKIDSFRISRPDTFGAYKIEINVMENGEKLTSGLLSFSSLPAGDSWKEEQSSRNYPFYMEGFGVGVKRLTIGAITDSTEIANVDRQIDVEARTMAALGVKGARLQLHFAELDYGNVGSSLARAAYEGRMVRDHVIPPLREHGVNLFISQIEQGLVRNSFNPVTQEEKDHFYNFCYTLYDEIGDYPEFILYGNEGAGQNFPEMHRYYGTAGGWFDEYNIMRRAVRDLYPDMLFGPGQSGDQQSHFATNGFLDETYNPDPQFDIWGMNNYYAEHIMGRNLWATIRPHAPDSAFVIYPEFGEDMDLIQWADQPYRAEMAQALEMLERYFDALTSEPRLKVLTCFQYIHERNKHSIFHQDYAPRTLVPAYYGMATTLGAGVMTGVEGKKEDGGYRLHTWKKDNGELVGVAYGYSFDFRTSRGNTFKRLKIATGSDTAIVYDMFKNKQEVATPDSILELFVDKHYRYITGVDTLELLGVLPVDSAGGGEDHFSVQMEVLDKANDQPLEGVSLLWDGQTYTTDATGEILLSNVPYAFYDVRLSYPGYDTLYKNKVVLVSDTTLVYTMQEDFADVEIVVTDSLSGDPVSPVRVEYNDQVFSGDEEGRVVIQDLPPGTYALEVISADYHVSGFELQVSESDTTLEVALLPKYMEVFFEVVDQAEPVANASVMLGSRSAVTDSRGEAIFYEIPSLETYTYQVSKEGYTTSDGTFLLETDTTLQVNLTPVGTGAGDPVHGSIQIYPNPAGDHLYLERVASPGELFLLDISGRILRQYPLDRGSNRLFLGDLEAGSYVLRFIRNEQVGRHTLIKL